MTRTETLRHAVGQSHAARLVPLAEQMQTLAGMHNDLSERMAALRVINAASAEAMAQALVPVAEALAALTEETRRTLGLIAQSSQQHHRQTSDALAVSTARAEEVLRMAQARTLLLDSKVERLEEIAREIRDRPHPSPWGPVLVAAALAVAAVVVLHRAGVL